jgi:hypothetical protein
VSRHTCRLWREQFIAEGPEGLWEVAQGPERMPEPGSAERIVKATLESKPHGQTPWSNDGRGARGRPEHGARIGQEHRLQPHRPESFQLSRDTEFVPTIVPETASERGGGVRGRASTWTHDNLRHGTSMLFAALWRPERSLESVSCGTDTRSSCASCARVMRSMSRHWSCTW